MHDQAIAHFKEQLHLLAIEKEAEVSINKQFIETSSVNERVKKGFSWYPLEIKEEGYGLGEYPYALIERTKNKGGKHRFRSGNPVELFNTKGEERLQAVIHYINDDQMKLIFHIEELPHWVHSSSLGINFLVDEKSFSEMERAIKFLLKTENHRTIELTETILGIRKPYFLDVPQAIEIPHLNDSQNQALNDMISAHDLGIIHGPPGTGKTTTLVQIIKQLAKGEKHILVCTPSNAAADLLTNKLAEQKLNVVRVGSISRVDEELLVHTLDEQLKSCKEYGEIKKIKKQAAEYRRMAGKFKRSFGKAEREQRNMMYKQAKSLSKDAADYEDHLIDKLFDEADVITCTLVGSTTRYLHNRKFYTVIIDEAAQALEAATWIPISKGQKVILAGDPFQLPPTIKSREAAKLGFGKTLLERCIAEHEKVNLLDTQYRMNEEIMNFSNHQFYEGKLKADDSVKNHLIDDKAMQFIDTAGCGFEEKKDKESLSLYNQGEVDLVNKIISQHLTIHHDEFSIGIISPYRQQVERLNDNISKAYDYLPNVKIDTIDSFQGQERDFIIISLVRSNENNEIGFLKDYRRLNVALTRARKKLIVIGDSATLASDKFYGQFMDYIDSIDGYHSAYEFMYEE
jgi:ATP-dependent RNA/DNA helicase IGHMBP2